MNYFEAFEKVRNATEGLTAGAVADHLAIQVNLSDEDASGICYLEATDGTFHAEPYDYRDRDALFTVKCEDLVAVLTGGKAYDTAVAEGILTVTGDTERAALLKLAIPAPAKKRGRKPAGGKTASAQEKPATTRKPRTRKTEP